MPKGPEEQKLEAWLRGSHEGVVDGGGRAWLDAGLLLDKVQMSIAQAARQVTGLGGDTGPAASAAFVKAAEAMAEKAGELRLGGDTLGATAGVVGNARGRYAGMGEPPVEPSAPAPPAPGSPPSDKDLQKQAAYRSDLASYQEQSQAREAHCKAITDDMTAQYHQSTADMKRIHGEPDPAPQTTTTTSGGGGTTSPSGGGSRTYTSTTTHHSSTTSAPSGTPTHTSGTSTPAHTATGPGPAGSTTTGSQYASGSAQYPSGNAQSSWSESGPGSSGTALPGVTSGVTSGATAPASSMGAGAGITGGAGLVGGLAASGLSGNLTGGPRGGITPVSTSAAGVRPIGSAARTGASGTLGRGTTTVGSGTGSSGSGTSRSGGRSGSSSRGAAGGRGTGGTGRGGDRTRDRSRKSRRDHLDEEWEIEDEDVAPPVLD